jgi:hypothetical protein
MNSVSRILGEAVRPPTKRELTDPDLAYSYAQDVIKGPWPKGEKAIARYPYPAYNYAKYILKGRFPAGEKAIALSYSGAPWREEYLEKFPEAKLEWIMNGWLDWLDT